MFLLLSIFPLAAQTQSDLGVVVSACQFFAGSPLTQQDQAAIIADIKNDFSTDPAKAAQDIQGLRALGSLLSRLGCVVTGGRPGWHGGFSRPSSAGSGRVAYEPVSAAATRSADRGGFREYAGQQQGVRYL